MNKQPPISRNAGQSLIELLLAIGLATLLLPALLTGFVASRSGRAQLEQRELATALAREGQEAIRVVREKDWTTFAANGTYYLAPSGTSWALIPGAEPPRADGFGRTIIIADVYRDISGNIVTSGGILDSSTKKITITVNWDKPQSTSVTETVYLSRFVNQSYSETSQSDFQKGTYGASVAVTNSSGGEVTLGAGVGGGDWCIPGPNVVATYDLTHSGIPVAITASTQSSQDLAFTTTGNNSSGNAVDALTVTQTSPPTVTNPLSNNEAKAYGIYTDGTHVYFNESSPPAHTVRIAQASNLANVGSFDPTTGKATGNSVFVSGTVGYTTGGSALYSFDLTSKNGARPQLGKINLAGNGNRVVVVGKTAYVATSSPTNQLQIIDVTDPKIMSITKNINLGNNLPGIDVYVNATATYAYIVTSYAAGKNSFFIVDLNNTANVWGFSTNGMNPKGIIVPIANRAIIVGSGGQPYQVFDISTPQTTSLCGGMTPSGVTSINAVSGVTQALGRVYSYIVTDNASAEFQVIIGGPGGNTGLYSTNGTFESQTLNTNHPVAFNYFSASTILPVGTAITFKVAIKNAVSGSCPGFSDADFVSISPGAIAIPGIGFANPGQCMRYRVLLSTTDTGKTPVFSDITFNYSL